MKSFGVLGQDRRVVVHRKAAVAPREQKLDALLGKETLFSKKLKDFVAEEELGLVGVDVRHRLPLSVIVVQNDGPKTVRFRGDIETGRLGGPRKGVVTVVAVKHVRSEVGYIDIGVPIVVIICRRTADTPALVAHPGMLGRLEKDPISFGTVRLRRKRKLRCSPGYTYLAS